MIDPRKEEITKELISFGKQAEKWGKLLTTELVSYELINGDIESLLGQKERVLNENKILSDDCARIRKEIEESKHIAKSIIDVAKEENLKIIAEGVKEYEVMVKKIKELKDKALADHVQTVRA